MLPVTASDADIHISEVFADGGAGSGADAGFAHDFIELTNTGSQDETLTGWSLKDDTDSHNYPIDDGTVIPAGGYVAFNVDDTTHTGNFGIGKGGDAARVYDGTTLVDQFWFTAAAGDGNDFDRCSIGAGAFAVVRLHRHHPGRGERLPHSGGRPRHRQEPGQGQRGARQRHRLGRRAAARRDRALQHGHDLGQPRPAGGSATTSPRTRTSCRRRRAA